MRWFERIIKAHLEVTDEVRHSERIKDRDRYIVWQEDGANDLLAGGRHAEQAVTGRSDLFTKQEFDPWSEALGRAFSRNGIAWSLVTVDYEEDTGFYHYSWDWEVTDGKEEGPGHSV